MPIPEPELQKYQEDAMAFLEEIGGDLIDVYLNKYAKVKFNSKPLKPPLKAHGQTHSDYDGEVKSFPEDDIARGSVFLSIEDERDKEHHMDIRAIKHIPADIGVEAELVETPYDLNAVEIYFGTEETDDLFLQGRTIEAVGSHVSMDEEIYQFLKDKLIPAAKKYGFEFARNIETAMVNYEWYKEKKAAEDEGT